MEKAAKELDFMLAAQLRDEYFAPEGENHREAVIRNHSTKETSVLHIT